MLSFKWQTRMIALYIMLPVCLPETESGAVGQSGDGCSWDSDLESLLGVSTEFKR